jgi:hypothetical protein
LFLTFLPFKLFTATDFSHGQELVLGLKGKHPFLRNIFFSKGWWQDATLFVYFSYFLTFIYSFNHIQTVHLSIAIRRGLSPFLHCLSAQWETLHCGAEPRIELGPALQQADALPTEPRRTITEPRRTILSRAAP